MAERRCEVLVVGAGPAGLAAAAAAAGDGADVLVVDENPRVGGQIWREQRGRGPQPGTRRLVDRALHHGARFLPGLGVFDAPAPDRLRALDRDGRPVDLRAERIVLATGATELFLPFPGWTLPGVFGVGGLQALVKGGMDVAGARVVVAGSGPLLLAVAAGLRRAGARVLGVFEQAPRRAVTRFGLGLWRQPGKLLQAGGLFAGLRGIPRRHDAWPLRAEGAGRLARVSLSVGGRTQDLDCDLLACAFGLSPSTRLAELCGAAVEDGRVRVDELQRTSVPTLHCAGEPTGIGGVEVALLEGRIAGHAAAGREAAARTLFARLRRARRFAAALDGAFALRPELRALPDDETIVCRCEDLRFGAVRGRADARQTKLETRCGMGPCQARICGPALEFLCGFARDRVRPPLFPVPAAAHAEPCAAATPSPTEQESDR
jgi:NADPH-dependent 2,4-dienoyl-CoA reductase/sulfur reductase-like enzyme